MAGSEVLRTGSGRAGCTVGETVDGIPPQPVSARATSPSVMDLSSAFMPRTASERIQIPTDRRRRNKISIKAASMVNRDTAPTVNGAVIMAVNAHASGCTPTITRSKLDFAHFKRRRRGNLQVGGTERRGVPEYRGQRLDFVQSGGVSKGVEHPAVCSARNFYQFRAGLRRGKIFLLRPDVSSDQTDGVGESGVGFGIPRR